MNTPTPGTPSADWGARAAGGQSATAGARTSGLAVASLVTGLFFWWQVRLLQKHRLPDPVAQAAPRSDAVS